MRRGVKEALAALAALPVLLVAGIYVGGRIGADDPPSLQPAAPVAGELRSPSPLVTVKPAAPRPVVTLTAAAPRPVVAVKPAAPAPQVPVRPHAPVSAPPTAGSLPSLPGSELDAVAPATPPAAPRATLGRGSADADVRAWQRQLARRGWRITVDGIFGPQTQRVARQFQREKGLRYDGLVGRQTWNAAWRLPVVRTPPVDRHR